MKPNRSNRYTTGLVCTFKDNDLRVFFFEVDHKDKDRFLEINEFYRANNLDFVVHKTGSGGFHWLSPTMITKEFWKELHKELKHINKECPMTTLRIEPNKHVGEENIWYNSAVERWNADSYASNNEQIWQLLNHIWGSELIGTGAGEHKQVKYPLPLFEGE